jgi:CHAD domain-containing protein
MVRSLIAALDDPRTLYHETARTGSIYKGMINDTFDQFYKKANRLTSDARAHSFHRVRIKGKELRYTLEFFNVLAKRALSGLMDIMSSMQDRLGAINDDRIAQATLLRLITDHRRAFSSRALFAIGEAYMHNVYEEKQRRKDFLDAFAAIAWDKLS